ncbi:MAG: TonB-dependent receptor [Bacteroidota bacterium]
MNVLSRIIAVSFLCLCFLMSFSQIPTQVVRGKVIDLEAKAGLEGAHVVVLHSDPLLGAVTNADGSFRIENVPVGRHNLQASFLGYKTAIIPEILISSGKQTVLTIELEEMAITEKEVEVKAGVDKDRALNAMAMVSARSFNVEESRRYAGSVDDPMRAASNFAGVASNAGVNSNQIMIRGNSPKGLLWRVEGADIPNPNHFAFVGTSGGGFTIFSSQVLSNSDFYTSAFPAQFGNALSGVFDMRFRNGNNARHEYAIQLGVQGLDIAAEGPFSKQHSSSYLFNYRYSILYFLGYIDPGMKNVIPSFQDLSFKLNFPTKKAGTFSVIGIGGASKITSEPKSDSADWNTLDDRSKSSLNNIMGAVSVNHQIYLNRESFFRSYISATYNKIVSQESLMSSGYQLKPEADVNHQNLRINASVTYNQKFGTRYTVRTGFIFSSLFYKLDMQSRNPFTGVYGYVNQGSGQTGILQAFIEARNDFTNNFSLTGGLNFEYFSLNGHSSLEPRLALRWQLATKHALSFGYGTHSQLEDIGVYLTEVSMAQSLTAQPNRGLNFSRAQHFVLGYDYLIRQDMRLKIEAYYQYLYGIPVIPGSYYSQLNSTGYYISDTLVNKGSGRNAGIDITFEKFLTKQYYYLVTVSLFDSKYKGGDGIERNTRFNANYVVNLLGGKEWTIRSKNILGVNLKGSFTGGEYYVPVNLGQSVVQHREILDEPAAYTVRLPAVFYLDLTITYRTNHKKFSGIWALQVRNLLNQSPIVGYVYDDFNHTVETQRSLGIIPLLSYKVEF